MNDRTLDTEYAEQRACDHPAPPTNPRGVACVCGVAAWIRFLDEGLVLSHYDAKAHLVVARRVIDSITPGWQQIGAVWLPLPHLIQILPTQVDVFYRTGAFASLVSIASFAVMVWAAARLVLAMTGSALGAATAAALLIANPNLLYLQSTPMTEPLMLASVFVVVLWLYEWVVGVPASIRRRRTAPPRFPSKLGWALFAGRVDPIRGLADHRRGSAGRRVRAACDAVLGLRRAAMLLARLAAWPAAAVVLFALNSRIATGRWLVTGGFYEIDPTYHGLPLKSLIAVWWGTHRLSGYVVETVALATAGWLIVRALARPSTAGAPHSAGAVRRRRPAVLRVRRRAPFRVRYMVVLAAACALVSGLAVAHRSPATRRRRARRRPRHGGGRGITAVEPAGADDRGGAVGRAADDRAARA